MGSQVRFKLAETLRAGLDEFAERWVRFLRANDLVPDTDEPQDEEVNRARLGFEVLANLLQGADYTKFENVVRRLLYDWISSAACYEDLLAIEEAFPQFILPHLEMEEDCPESNEILSAINEFFNSPLRAQILSLYLQVYDEIIGAESRHTAYVLGHFDAILSLTAHLNGAETRAEVIEGLPGVLKGLFENVLAVGVWIETPDGLAVKSVEILDEDVPASVLDEPLPEKLEEVFNIGDAAWVRDNELPSGFRSLIGIEVKSTLSGCAIPVRPREADGLLVLLLVSADHPGLLELSLSRVASAECALALDRVSGAERIGNVNRCIKDILALSRETSWGSSYRDTGELVLETLLDVTGGKRAILLASPASATGSATWTPLAWLDLTDDEIEHYRRGARLPAIVTIPLKSRKAVLLSAHELESVLAGRLPPPGFEPAENQALGVLPLEMSGRLQGICLFLCPARFASSPESADVLAIFARTAADCLSTAREYERSLKMASIAEAESARARMLQQKLTPRYKRSGNLVYWAHLQPAGELAGDVLMVRSPSDGRLNVWAADVAGRGPSIAWSMIFIRQLLAELPHDIENTSRALAEINEKLHEIETKTSPGIFTTLVGLHLDEKAQLGRFSRAGAPWLIRIGRDGEIEKLDPEGLPLGLFPDAGLEEIEFAFKPGDKLVWVSDGLLGIRNEAGKVWGESGLLDCVRDNQYLPARALYECILSSVGEFASDDLARDDWSLVVAAHDPDPDWSLSLPGDEREKLLKKSLSWLKKGDYAVDDFNAVRVLLDEAVKNAHEHGNRLDERALIEIRLNRSPRHIHIRVRDEGGRLNERVTTPHLRPEKILEDKGRGFLLMRHQSSHLWVDEDRGELNAVRILEENE